MSIFGQVWLWSVAAFALGALLAWALLARPAQARVRELERRLVTAETAPPVAPPRDPEPTRVQQAPPQRDDAEHTQQLQQVRPEPAPEPDPEPTEYVSPAPAWLERDSLEHAGEAGRDETVERELAEYDWDADPEPGHDAAGQTPDDGHVQAQSDTGHDETGYDDTRYDETRYDETGYDQDYAAYSGEANPADPQDEGQGYQEQAQEEVALPEESAAERTSVGVSLFQPQTLPENGDARDYDAYDDQPYDTEARTESLTGNYEPQSYRPFEPVYVGPDTGERDEEQTQAYQPAEPEEPEAEPETEDGAGTAQGLPKRQRRESPRGGFDAPKPIQPSMRTVSRREPAQDQGSTHSGSLFEPAVPSGPSADPAAPVPPPARSSHGAEQGGAPIPSGPFGPGSAMPLPGGGRPAPDFTVKASVTALRYCTDGSPQFPQMVAEVWFRTPADAERVGFRPLS